MVSENRRCVGIYFEGNRMLVEIQVRFGIAGLSWQVEKLREVTEVGLMSQQKYTSKMQKGPNNSTIQDNNISLY